MTSPTDRASTAWRPLALAALGGGALLALLLVVGRTPLFSALIAPAAFERALVLHVTLISVIWLAAMSAQLWGAGRGSARLAMLGTALMAAAGLGGFGAPVLADYLPYLDHPIFLLGAGLFAAGVLFAALGAPCTFASPWQAALLFMRLPLVVLTIEWLTRRASGAPIADSLWGVGHGLQIAWTVLLLGLWSRTAPRPGTGILLIGATALLSLVAPGLSWLGQADAHALHSAVMRTGLGSSLLVGLMIFQPWRGAPATRWAALLSALGLMIGLLIDGQSTTIPAHYHGTVGAVSLSLLALAVPQARKAMCAHAIGLLMMMAGLLTAGLAGLARKQVLDLAVPDALVLLGSSFVGLGGLIAALAVIAAVASTRRAEHRFDRRLETI